MQNIVLIGASGHAKVIIDIIERAGRYRLVGLLDRNKKPGDTLLGYPVLGVEESLRNWQTVYDIVGGIVAIGDNWIRHIVAQKMRSIDPNFRFVTAIHPSASIGKRASIGAGTVIMAGATVNPDSHIGTHCILNTQSSLDHDCSMANFASLAPGAITGGNVHIGTYSAISLGAKLIHGITVGEHSVVGAGSLVLKDIDPYQIAYGSPAKAIRQREKGERYL